MPKEHAHDAVQGTQQAIHSEMSYWADIWKEGGPIRLVILFCTSLEITF